MEESSKERGTSFDVALFAALIHEQRGPRGLRQIALESGVSASTLSRLEREEKPDMRTFCRVCHWLGVSPDRFLRTTQAASEPVLSTPEKITLLLYQDQTLPSDLAEALVMVVRLVYRPSQ